MTSLLSLWDDELTRVWLLLAGVILWCKLEVFL